MNKTLKELNKTKWYRLLKIIYAVLLIVAIATAFGIGYENEGLILWGYFLQFSLLWTIIALVALYVTKRIFYYIYFGHFMPETNEKKALNHWELLTVGILLILLCVNWMAWKPSHRGIECHLATTGAISGSDNFEQKWAEEYPKFLSCLIKHGIGIENKKEQCSYYKQTALNEDGDDSTKIFYSPSMDTCIFAYWDYQSSEDDTHYNTTHVIKDLFTNTTLFSQTNAPLWQEKIEGLKK